MGISNKFKLKPGQSMDFVEAGISFDIKSESNKEREIEIIIK